MSDNVTPITRTADAVKPPRPPRFPESVEEKVTVAKSIVLAVLVAHDSGNLDDENYDQSWPLRMAIELLDQAADQIDRERLDVSHG